MNDEWPEQPVIYEVNTWVWLNELSASYGRDVDLSNVPGSDWDGFAGLAYDAVWLMGVWQRSPRGREIAGSLPALTSAYRTALSDFDNADVSGSPYSIQEYTVDARLGGPKGLAKARQELRKRGIRLILDFVPNHLAPDHPWVASHPEYFVHGTEEDLRRSPHDYFQAGERVLAHGKDPYFPAWTDTVQLNAFEPAMRKAMGETLTLIAGQCDGVRCDMAMLLMNEVFSHTWGVRAGPAPNSEYWQDVISVTREANSNFIFIAEAYWNKEKQLQDLGFDYCYDKRLYDHLIAGSAAELRCDVSQEVAYQRKLLRFLENHDEPRAAAALAPDRHRAAAVTMATLPGAKLYLQGQFSGFRIRLPVQLGRAPIERPDQELAAFYSQLLHAVHDLELRGATWKLREVSGWADNHSAANVVAWSWESAKAHCLVIVNFSGTRSQGKVLLDWPNLGEANWRLSDPLNQQVFVREGRTLAQEGLFIDLDPWRYHLLKFEKHAS